MAGTLAPATSPAAVHSGYKRADPTFDMNGTCSSIKWVGGGMMLAAGRSGYKPTSPAPPTTPHNSALHA
jgi:hypothetical protein